MLIFSIVIINYHKFCSKTCVHCLGTWGTRRKQRCVHDEAKIVHSCANRHPGREKQMTKPWQTVSLQMASNVYGYGRLSIKPRRMLSTHGQAMSLPGQVAVHVKGQTVPQRGKNGDRIEARIVHTGASSVRAWAIGVTAECKRTVMAGYIVSLWVQICVNACQVNAKDWAGMRPNRGIHAAMSGQADDCGEANLRTWQGKCCPRVCKQCP